MIKSQEQLTRLVALAVTLVIALLTSILVWQYQARPLFIITLWVLLLPLCYLGYSRFKQALFTPYRNIQTQLDAIQNGETHVRSQIRFSTGVAKSLHDDVLKLARQASRWQVDNQRHALLVNELLQSMNSPIVLINDDNRVIMGNEALSNWLGYGWQSVRLKRLDTLGFSFNEHWSLESKNESDQLRTSQISLDGKLHTLMLITDIQDALSAKQQQSWQQIVRVMSHEIKNSLTPIKSLAQSLAEFSNDEMQKQMLGVIVERSEQLHQFVANFSDLEKPITLSASTINTQSLCLNLTILYPSLTVSFNNESIYADKALLEQVLINLIKNAFEARDPEKTTPIVELCIKQSNIYTTITVQDNGIGLSNLDNLFVPFFTTKKEGQGIGLVWCKRVIESHNGKLNLYQTKERTIAEIRLPIQK
ncbi:ATP-binding protein (plasmid) [Pseudoalteromonas xiamenensis]|uniref:sensor histidine kinase n=1 Tax=Pseudoalteromonas xiamenensis TaxID=882626 RepID=UPI0027E4C87C|nr:ATP-binding protein [Pseudoalteromonas xiamenensis]WMN61983.1 ATP-binding protein [Pseudoalteromonas xiamenensis]